MTDSKDKAIIVCRISCHAVDFKGNVSCSEFSSPEHI